MPLPPRLIRRLEWDICPAKFATRTSTAPSIVSCSDPFWDVENLLTASPDLSAPVDVYSEWVDACDAVAKENKAAEASRPRPSAQAARKQSREEDDDDLIDDGDDYSRGGRGGYGGEGIVDDDDEDDY